MPFYDSRIANFAWSRPPTDLSQGREQKVILRLAMENCLPPEVVAPRGRRTGTSDSYFHRVVARELPRLVNEMGEGSLLADLGLVDQALLRSRLKAWESADETQQLLLVIAYSVETWLQAQNSQNTFASGTDMTF